MTTRRTFLGGMAAILASGVAPASARSGVLMPIRPAIIAPPKLGDTLVFRRWIPYADYIIMAHEDRRLSIVQGSIDLNDHTVRVLDYLRLKT